MRVLLTDDIVGVGDIGESVSVRPGFARNYLIPRGLAIETGAASAKSIAHRMRQIEAKKKQLQSVATEKANELSNKTVELTLRVGKGGKVFGSITARHIAEALTEQGFEVDRRRILLNEPIKRIGSREVKVKLHPEVVTNLAVNVSAVDATAEEQQREADEAKQKIEAAADARQEEGSEEEALLEEELEASGLTEDED